jgi:hypothetical protein
MYHRVLPFCEPLGVDDLPSRVTAAEREEQNAEGQPAA